MRVLLHAVWGIVIFLVVMGLTTLMVASTLDSAVSPEQLGYLVGRVSADGKLTHPADRKLTHLGRGWRPLGGRLDVDPGGSSGSEGVGPSGQRGA